MQTGNRTWIIVLSVAGMVIGGAQIGRAGGAASTAEEARQGSAVEHAAAVSAKAARLREDMRKLWSDHVIWTRG
jgi:hypothetical protein